MLMNPFVRRSDPHLLAVSMTGVKMGDRVAFVGCAHGGRLAAVAAKVGLSGGAQAIVPDGKAADLARTGAEQVGVLLEIDVAPPTALPIGDAGVDLAVVDDTGDLLGLMTAEERAASVRELVRILRPGGRVIVIGSVARTGLAGLLTRAPSAPSFAASGQANQALEAGGFGIVRTLAEREGLVFVEGIKPRGPLPFS
jgi:ubiquinone/menaquinone biosynthesis C-methylase UbiE